MEAEQGCTAGAFSSTCSELQHYLRGTFNMTDEEKAEDWEIVKSEPMKNEMCYRTRT